MQTLLDLLGSLVDWGPIGLTRRRWVRRYEAGERVFLRGTVSGLAGSSRWASWLVAADHMLSVADEKGEDAVLHPLPSPSPDSRIEDIHRIGLSSD